MRVALAILTALAAHFLGCRRGHGRRRTLSSDDGGMGRVRDLRRPGRARCAAGDRARLSDELLRPGRALCRGLDRARRPSLRRELRALPRRRRQRRRPRRCSTYRPPGRSDRAASLCAYRGRSVLVGQPRQGRRRHARFRQGDEPGRSLGRDQLHPRPRRRHLVPRGRTCRFDRRSAGGPRFRVSEWRPAADAEPDPARWARPRCAVQPTPSQRPRGATSRGAKTTPGNRPEHTGDRSGFRIGCTGGDRGIPAIRRGCGRCRCGTGVVSGAG